jgi:hypothetical protein
VSNPTTRCPFYTNTYNTCTKLGRTSTKMMWNQAAGAAPAAAEPRIIEYLSIRGGGRSIQRPRSIKHQWHNNLLVRARNHNLPDVSRVGSPPKPRVPRLTTVQRGGVMVLDEPSMVGLMVWAELPSRRPWFGWSIMMVKARGVKIRVESGSSWKLLILSMSGRPSHWGFRPSEFPWLAYLQYLWAPVSVHWS